VAVAAGVVGVEGVEVAVAVPACAGVAEGVIVPLTGAALGVIVPLTGVKVGVIVPLTGVEVGVGVAVPDVSGVDVAVG
jgi:hypothetical protein